MLWCNLKIDKKKQKIKRQVCGFASVRSQRFFFYYTFEKRQAPYNVFELITRFVCLCVCVCHRDCDKTVGFIATRYRVRLLPLPTARKCNIIKMIRWQNLDHIYHLYKITFWPITSTRMDGFEPNFTSMQHSSGTYMNQNVLVILSKQRSGLKIKYFVLLFNLLETSITQRLLY